MFSPCNTCPTWAHTPRAFCSCCQIACASSLSCASRQPRYLNTSKHSSMSLWTKNWQHRANAEHTTDSCCNFHSAPVWHSFVWICRGYAELTCITHHSHCGKYPSVKTTTLLKGCRSLKCHQSIHPPRNFPAHLGTGHLSPPPSPQVLMYVMGHLCLHHLLVDLMLVCQMAVEGARRHHLVTLMTLHFSTFVFPCHCQTIFHLCV